MALTLTGFRIKNFRSIIDTGWQNLSIDNITSIIGQNESGKTSVLHAINSFFSGKITEDDIRSSNKLPEISCSFAIDLNDLNNLLKDELINKKTSKFLETKKRINISSYWEVQNISSQILKLEETEFINTFELAKEKPQKKEETLTSEETAPKLDKEKLQKKDEIQTSEEEVNVSESITSEEFIKKILPIFPDIVLFEPFSSLLPDLIDIDDIEKNNEKAEGFTGVKNFLNIAKITLDLLKMESLRIQGDQLLKINQEVTADFREFWTQKIGKLNKISISIELRNHPHINEKKAGKPYLVFWVQDEEGKLYLKQRSQGVNWFISFYLQLKSAAIDRVNLTKKLIFLIDEPGASLHARAQEDALKIFDEIRDKNIQIIYTTHSAYFLKTDLLFRVLALQRGDEDDDKSDTRVLDIHKLSSASSDTLSPIYTCMGIDFSHQNVIQKTNNVILEEPSAHYYLKSFLFLLGNKEEINFIPATGCSNIPTLVNLFLGWGIEWIVVFDDEPSAREKFNEIKKNIFRDNEEEALKKMYKIKDCLGIEDIFSKNDFIKNVLEDDIVEYSKKTSEFLKESKLSKGILSYKFYSKVLDSKLKLKDLEKETQENIESLIEKILEMLNLNQIRAKQKTTKVSEIKESKNPITP